MEKLDMALRVAFTENYEELIRDGFDTDKFSRLFGVRLFFVDNWAEIRAASREYLAELLGKLV